jgi:hypothetical protein
MKKVEDYLRHAAECRMLAQRALPEHRDMLLHMAGTWESLAKSRQAQIARKKRLASLDDGGEVREGEGGRPGAS